MLHLHRPTNRTSSSVTSPAHARRSSNQPPNRNVAEQQEIPNGQKHFRQAVSGAMSKMKIMSALANSIESKDLRDQLTLGQLPPEAERLKYEDVSKLCQGEWQPRILLLTANDLIISYPGKNQISDKIPLVRIVINRPIMLIFCDRAITPTNVICIQHIRAKTMQVDSSSAMN